jgi:thioester reductase-like protein
VRANRNAARRSDGRHTSCAGAFLAILNLFRRLMLEQLIQINALGADLLNSIGVLCGRSRAVKSSVTSDTQVDRAAHGLYQRPYPVSGFAQERLVSEAMRSGICINVFQAPQHVSMMAS